MLKKLVLIAVIVWTVPAVAATSAADNCDALAGSPVDYQKPALHGVPAVFVDAAKAVKECGKAVAQNPDVPRYRFELGRSLVLAGDEEKGLSELEKASAAGYAAASYTLGRLYSRDEYLAPDLKKALSWFERARSQKHKDAAAEIGRIHSGLFYEHKGANEKSLIWNDPKAISKLFEESMDDHSNLGLFLYGAHCMMRIKASGKRDDFGYQRCFQDTQAAAAHGEPEAQYRLGFAYFRKGQQVLERFDDASILSGPKNMVEAQRAHYYKVLMEGLQYLKDAAESGDVRALYLLLRIYIGTDERGRAEFDRLNRIPALKTGFDILCVLPRHAVEKSRVETSLKGRCKGKRYIE